MRKGGKSSITSVSAANGQGQRKYSNPCLGKVLRFSVSTLGELPSERKDDWKTTTVTETEKRGRASS